MRTSPTATASIRIRIMFSPPMLFATSKATAKSVTAGCATAHSDAAVDDIRSASQLFTYCLIYPLPYIDKQVASREGSPDSTHLGEQRQQIMAIRSYAPWELAPRTPGRGPAPRMAVDGNVAGNVSPHHGSP